MSFVLASSSPRRKKLLEDGGFTFEIEKPSYDERHLRLSPAEIYTMQLALQKAMSVKGKRPEDTVVAVDTVVVLDDKILGKPKDRAEAEEMLLAMKGRRHRVISAYAVLGEEKYVDYDQSFVRFEDFTETQMKAYLDKNTYMDKAGAYGVQEIDEFEITVEGAMDTVIGMHVASIEARLKGLKGADRER